MVEVLRALSVADINACLALSTEANWNQEAADWEMILTTGEGRGIVEEGRLIASAAIVPYGGRFGWICMVLVAAEARRRGHATRLMRWGISRLENLGLVPGLDATPAGREVYRRLGFSDIYALSRLECANVDHFLKEPDSIALRPLGVPDLGFVAKYDASKFGAARDRLIASLAGRRPEIALVAERKGAIAGFVLGRGGRLATQIGPLVADDESVAVALVQAALLRTRGPAFIDVCDGHAGFVQWLAARGFRRQRPFTRMLKGRARPLDEPEKIFAVTGPEFG